MPIKPKDAVAKHKAHQDAWLTNYYEELLEKIDLELEENPFTLKLVPVLHLDVPVSFDFEVADRLADTYKDAGWVVKTSIVMLKTGPMAHQLDFSQPLPRR